MRLVGFRAYKSQKEQVDYLIIRRGEPRRLLYHIRGGLIVVEYSYTFGDLFTCSVPISNFRLLSTSILLIDSSSIFLRSSLLLLMIKFYKSNLKIFLVSLISWHTYTCVFAYPTHNSNNWKFASAPVYSFMRSISMNNSMNISYISSIYLDRV